MTGIGGEAARKSIHVLLSLAAAGLVWRLPHTTAAAVLAAAVGLALATEALRLASPAFAARFAARLGPMLRATEATRLTGATTLALGYTAAVVLFPGRAALAGILLVGVADAVAAVVGRRWGRHRYPGGKSVEGSAAFVAIAVAIGVLLGLGPAHAAALALAVAVVEALTLPVDDNLYLPAVGAAVFRAIAGV